MRPLTIDLPRLEAALDDDSGNEHYLDLETGGIFVAAPEDPVPGAMEKYDVQPDRYLPIDPLPTGEAVGMREGFLFTLHDPHAHTVLSHALAGRKPLRTFDYELEKYPEIRQAWLDYRAVHLRERALEWLQENGLEAARR
ncbi:UPF0158 family protein [Pseudomonas indica]|uniref:Uncharacterized protein family (UPF0158) n=1 Tax=Pseudomonas indica TaxID=137658 RepID=A0A1G8SW49_9PSED|nr:UPF0158 family protein [Pseudomonas indica]MBU3055111.1 UPF0158 family protein [Pseudomonas indica]SDJ33469.1 Uncharacterised protein family (UPF0158) [Pseudomonas indica]